jgi:hypothetical protein
MTCFLQQIIKYISACKISFNVYKGEDTAIFNESHLIFTLISKVTVEGKLDCTRHKGLFGAKV